VVGALFIGASPSFERQFRIGTPFGGGARVEERRGPGVKAKL
jgi:hypothetical protein